MSARTDKNIFSREDEKTPRKIMVSVAMHKKGLVEPNYLDWPSILKL